MTDETQTTPPAADDDEYQIDSVGRRRKKKPRSYKETAKEALPKKYVDAITGGNRALPNVTVKDANTVESHVDQLTKLVLSDHMYIAELREALNPSRQKLNADPETIRQLSAIGCRQTDIANLLGFNISAFQDNKTIEQAFQEGRSELRAGIGKKMVERALDGKGDTTMLIWLSKQYLDMRDNPTTQVNIQNNVDSSGLKEKLKAVLTVQPTTEATVVEVPPTGSDE